MRSARIIIIHDSRHYQPGSPRFILASLITFGIVIVLLVMAAAAIAKGQDEPRTPIKDAPKTAAPVPVPAPTKTKTETDTDAKPKVDAPTTPPTTLPTASASTATATADPCTTCKGPYCPTVLQCKNLSLVQKDLVIAAQSYNLRLAQEELKWDEYAQKQSAVQAMLNECRKVMDDNHWPATVRCTPNSSPIGFLIPVEPAASLPVAKGKGSSVKP